MAKLAHLSGYAGNGGNPGSGQVPNIRSIPTIDCGLRGYPAFHRCQPQPPVSCCPALRLGREGLRPACWKMDLPTLGSTFRIENASVRLRNTPTNYSVATSHILDGIKRSGGIFSKSNAFIESEEAWQPTALFLKKQRTYLPSLWELANLITVTILTLLLPRRCSLRPAGEADCSP